MDENISNQTEQISRYLSNQSRLDSLRFMTCGSVDDGKSTLIGRLLYEAQLIFEDQITALKQDSKKSGTQGGEIDFALLVDGLAAEREQGITIDVAYRYFQTDKRRFVVADTPGHEEYTRNMVTAASTVDLAVILIDASKGVLFQTKRHAFIASLLGLKQVVIAVNKMDLIGFNEERFRNIEESFRELGRLLHFENVIAIPISALNGDNVVKESTETSWYDGPTLLGALESISNRESERPEPLRFPIQWVNRSGSDFRGYSGTIASGEIESGKTLMAMPSGEKAIVDEIVFPGKKLTKATKNQAVTIVLDREIDLSRGDMLTDPEHKPESADQLAVNIVWMDKEPGYVGRSYLGVICGQQVNAKISGIKFIYDINDYSERPSHELQMNDVAKVTLSLSRKVVFDPYTENKVTGSLILIDKYSNNTIAAGMVEFGLRRALNIVTQRLSVDRGMREKLNGHKGRVVWLTGLSGSGKSTIANALEVELNRQGRSTYILDGDNIRQGLNKDLGFKTADRVENIRRIAEVSKLMLDAGLIVITSFISPFRSERDAAKSLFNSNEFLEIFVDVPLEIAEERDPKGLYKKARQGDLPQFTGIDSPYEPPVDPDLLLKTDESSLKECVESLLRLLVDIKT